MRYIFFDCECANNYDGMAKICSLGYVITDQYFNILQKKDVLINPKSHFAKRVLGQVENGIKLAYTPEAFKHKPTFDDYYDNLDYFFSQPDTDIFGFYVSNDLRFINEECDRYKRDKIKIKAYDIAKITGHFIPTEKDCSVEKIVNHLSIDKGNLVFHKSSDDAHMSMLILKEVARLKNLSPSDYRTDDFLVDSSFVKDSVHVKKSSLSPKNPSQRSLNLPDYPDSCQNNKDFNALYNAKNSNPSSIALKDVNFSFSCLCKEDMQRTWPLAKHIFDCDGMIVRSLDSAQIFVVYDEEEKNDLAIKGIPHLNSGVSVVLLNDLLS